MTINVGDVTTPVRIHFGDQTDPIADLGNVAVPLRWTTDDDGHAALDVDHPLLCARLADLLDTAAAKLRADADADTDDTPRGTTDDAAPHPG